MALATLKVDMAAGYGVTQERRPRKKRSRRCVEAPHGISEMSPTASMMAEPAQLHTGPLIVTASLLRELTPQEGMQAAASGVAVVRAICMPCPPRLALPAPPSMQRAHVR